MSEIRSIGAEKIYQERMEQLTKHKRSVNQDRLLNNNGQLMFAACLLCQEICNENIIPFGWSPELWNKMINKSRPERLIIAGALLAAEYDRIEYLKKKSINDVEDIDLSTTEGNLLMSALVKLSTESQQDKQPWEIIQQLNELDSEMNATTYSFPVNNFNWLPNLNWGNGK